MKLVPFLSGVSARTGRLQGTFRILQPFVRGTNRGRGGGRTSAFDGTCDVLTAGGRTVWDVAVCGLPGTLRERGTAESGDGNGSEPDPIGVYSSTEG